LPLLDCSKLSDVCLTPIRVLGVLLALSSLLLLCVLAMT